MPGPARWRLPREGKFWLLVALVTVAAGWFKTINLLLLLGYTMFGLLGINAWAAWAAARRVSAANVPLSPGFANRPFARAVDVRNDGRRPATLVLKEESPVHTIGYFLPALMPGEARRVTANFTLPARGKYPVAPVAAVAGYPFGLIEFVRPVTPAGEMIVLPAVGGVDGGQLRRWLIRTGAGDANTRRPVRRQGVHAADVRGVRGYRPGDSPRDVHWRTSARRGQLMVREYDSTDPLDLILIVEPWLPASPTPAQKANLEAALSLAATVFWAWAHDDESPAVTLAVAGPGGGVRTGNATEGFARNALGLLAAAVGTPGPIDVSADLLRTRSNRCARLIISSRPDSPLAGDLRRRSGLPFVPLDATRPVAWYTPPALPVPGHSS